MKRPDSFLTNTATATGRAEGEAVNNPGDNSGTGMDSEIYNDPAYALIGQISSYKEDGLSNADETTTDCDLRDAMEEMTEKAVKGVVDWDTTTTFGIGDNCMYLGYQWVSYVASNQNNIPLSNPDKWMKVKKSDDMLDAYLEGTIFVGGLQGIHDRAGSNYQTSLAHGSHRLGPAGSAFHNGFIVHLDGSIVNGDTALEAALDPGGANEHPYIDIIAPDVAGTRTLIDMGGKVIRAQSSSGKADTLGELQDDAMQRTTGGSNGVPIPSGSGIDLGGVFSGSLTSVSGIYGSGTAGDQISTLDFDSANSTSPNTAKTDDDETRMSNIVGGAAYIISMIPA